MVDSSWQGGTCSTMTTHPFSFSLRNGVGPTGVKLATGPEDVTHLVLSSNTHCGAALSSNTHCGAEDVTDLVLHLAPTHTVGRKTSHVWCLAPTHTVGLCPEGGRKVPVVAAASYPEIVPLS